MCDWLLDELNPDLQECLTIVVDGPLASNPLFATLLRALRPDDIVNAGDGREASVAAAHFLATGTPLTPSTPLIAENAAVDAELLSRYRSQWRDALTRQRAA